MRALDTLMLQPSSLQTPAPFEPWLDGWCPQATRVDSPNFGERPADCDVSLALIHSISLPPGEYGGDAIERLFTNRLDWDAHPYFGQIRGAEVSAHFLIRRGGELIQFVSVRQRAWHAGHSYWRDRDNVNDWSIGIELEGLEGERFEQAQYQQLARLLHAARRTLPLTEVAGHEHVAPGRKQDPGPGFDWALLAELLAAGSASLASVLDVTVARTSSPPPPPLRIAALESRATN